MALGFYTGRRNIVSSENAEVLNIFVIRSAIVSLALASGSVTIVLATLIVFNETERTAGTTRERAHLLSSTLLSPVVLAPIAGALYSLTGSGAAWSSKRRAAGTGACDSSRIRGAGVGRV